MPIEKRDAKKAFVAPRLEMLEVKGTATGPEPDPFETTPFLQLS